MGITVNIYYTGQNGGARAFAREMTESGLVGRIRAEEGNRRYEYFFPMEDQIGRASCRERVSLCV